MSRVMVMMTMTQSAAATAKVTMKTKLSQAHRAWQVPALGSKGAGIRLFLFKQKVTKMLTKSMSRVTGSATKTATATIATAMTNISHSYRAWQVPALGSKGAAITLFLYKCGNHVESDGNGDHNKDSNSSSNSDSFSNRHKGDNDTSVI